MPSIAPEAKTVEMPLDPAARRAVATGGLQLCATDAHRLTLQAKLTEIGVPPSPGDRGALRQLAAMDTESVEAVVRWLSHAAGLPQGTEAHRSEAPVGQAQPCAHTRTGDAPQSPALTHPADRMDPRLIAW